MLTVQEIADSMLHRCITGQRSTGHYDHDANLIIGPETSVHNNKTLIKPSGTKKSRYSTKSNPDTGEVVFVLKD